MKIARIYIKPAGDKWADLPLRDDQDLGIVFSVMRSTGALMLPSSFCIPTEQVHHIVLMETPEPAQPVPLWTPEGQKPN